MAHKGASDGDTEESFDGGDDDCLCDDLLVQYSLQVSRLGANCL